MSYEQKTIAEDGDVVLHPWVVSDHRLLLTERTLERQSRALWCGLCRNHDAESHEVACV